MWYKHGTERFLDAGRDIREMWHGNLRGTESRQVLLGSLWLCCWGD